MKKPRKKPDSWYGKAWFFIWHDNSIWSWIVNIILAFVLIKFILYPGLGLIMGTPLPVVAVVSESMEHRGSFDDWWHSPAVCDSGACTQQEWYLERNLNEADFKTFPFDSGFNKGDIMILIGKKPDKIKVGDVIVYASGKDYPIIHRVVRTWTEEGILYYETKGDHNERQIQDLTLNEKLVRQDKVFGVAVIRIPWLGWVKILAVDSLRAVLH
ncbi:MAG: signal peptidase I [Candidatus Woesearchaeota archaeon]